MKVFLLLLGLVTGCATNTANLPQLTCPDPIVLPEFSDTQLAELETLSRDTQLVIIERDALQTKRREMLQLKCRLFEG